MKAQSQILRIYQSENGVGLIEILISVVILAVVTGTMFISLSYANYRALINTHRRVALLAAQSEMEKIKFYNEVSKVIVLPSNRTVTIQSSTVGDPIIGTEYFTVTRIYDPSVTLTTFFKRVQLEIKWREHLVPFLGTHNLWGDEHSVKVVEDYYEH